MPLSPADVHNVAFSKPPIGKRGYNEDEVDQFLDLVEDALAQLQDENYELQKQVEDVVALPGRRARDGPEHAHASAGRGQEREHSESDGRLAGVPLRRCDVDAAGTRASHGLHTSGHLLCAR